MPERLQYKACSTSRRCNHHVASTPVAWSRLDAPVLTSFHCCLDVSPLHLLSKLLVEIGKMLYAHAFISVAKIVDSIAFACLLKCYVTFQVPLCSHCCCCCSCCTGIIEAAHLRCRTDSLFDSALGKKLRAARSYSHSGPKWPNLRVDTNAAQLRVSK